MYYSSPPDVHPMRSVLWCPLKVHLVLELHKAKASPSGVSESSMAAFARCLKTAEYVTLSRQLDENLLDVIDLTEQCVLPVLVKENLSV